MGFRVTGIWNTENASLEEVDREIDINYPISVLCLERGTPQTIREIKRAVRDSNIIMVTHPVTSLVITNDDDSTTQCLRCVEDTALTVQVVTGDIRRPCHVYQSGKTVFAFVAVPAVTKQDPKLIKSVISGAITDLCKLDQGFVDTTVPILIGMPIRMYQVVYSPRWYGMWLGRTVCTGAKKALDGIVSG